MLVSFKAYDYQLLRKSNIQLGSSAVTSIFLSDEQLLVCLEVPPGSIQHPETNSYSIHSAATHCKLFQCYSQTTRN